MADLFYRKDGEDFLFDDDVELVPFGTVDLATFGSHIPQKGENRFLLLSSFGWELDSDDLLFVRDDGEDVWIKPESWKTSESIDGRHFIWVAASPPPADAAVSTEGTLGEE